MEFRILGPLEVAVDGTTVTFGSAKQRALLGVLLLHANEVVSNDRLVDELWGPRPPPTSGKLVQVYVSQLRRALAAAGGADMLRTRAPGYMAVLELEQLDSTCFTSLLERARVQADAGALDQAVAGYDEALALWRGPVLADVAFESGAGTDAELLSELRLAALSERTDCELALGRHAQLIGELEALTVEHPLRERFWAQLMLALYRSGRQSEALGAYHQARRALREEVGIEPSPELHRLEKAILAHDPSLESTPPVPRPPAAPPQPPTPEAPSPVTRRARRLGRYRLPAAGFAVALLVGIVFAAVAIDRGDPPVALAAPSPDSLGIVDPERNELVDEIRLPGRPSAVAFGAASLWVGTHDDKTLLRIDPRTRETTTIGLGAQPLEIAIADGFVWVLSTDHVLFQLRSGTGSLVRRIPLPNKAGVGSGKGQPLHGSVSGCGELAAGGGAAWVGCWLPVVLKVDARTGAVEQFDVASGGGIAFRERTLWSAVGTFSTDLDPHALGALSRVDPRTGAVLEVIAPPNVGLEWGVSDAIAGPNRVWLMSGARAVWTIDPNIGRAMAVVPLHHQPIDIAVGEAGVWTANADGTVSRLDAQGERLVATIPLGSYPRVAYPVQLAVGGGFVWVAMH